ncbi:MAG: methyltransferase domain-containing protein [Candidatus Methanoperedens sp.]
MATVAEHYEDHLAQYYSWMFGDFNNMVEANRQFFIVHKLVPGNSKIAIDLGAGSGFASIALAKMGYKVIAIDLCQKLLDELKCHSGNLDITPIKDDLLNFTVTIKIPFFSVKPANTGNNTLIQLLWNQFSEKSIYINIITGILS